LIEPSASDAPPPYYRYTILTPGNGKRHAERHSQFLFDDNTAKWELQTSADEMRSFWPLYPDKELVLKRIDRETNVRANVSFLVLGLEPIDTGLGVYRSWKIRRLDHYSDGTDFFQFLWYAPELCTLSAFTDSQQRMIRLLRILHPGGRDYNRPLIVLKHHLYFADGHELVESSGLLKAHAQSQQSQKPSLHN
jgi:hypothetical protein